MSVEPPETAVHNKRPDGQGMAVVPVCNAPGKKGCGRVVLAACKGATKPSGPMRNALNRLLLGLRPPLQVPSLRVKLQVTGFRSPGPSNGTRTWLTPLLLPHVRP